MEKYQVFGEGKFHGNVVYLCTHIIDEVNQFLLDKKIPNVVLFLVNLQTKSVEKVFAQEIQYLSDLVIYDTHSFLEEDIRKSILDLLQKEEKENENPA